MSLRWTGSTRVRPSRVMSTSAASRSATWPSIVTTRRRSVGTTDSARRRAAPPRRTCPSAPPPSAQRTAPGSYTARGWVTGSPERGPHALGEDGHLRVELAAVGGEELEDQVLDAARGQLAYLLDQGGRLAREHAPAMRGRWRALARPQHTQVVAQRERRGRRAAAGLAEPCDLGLAGPQLRRRAIDRMPGGSEPSGAAERGPAVAADPDRRVRLLQGLGLEHEPAEPRVLARERRRAAGPELLHRRQILVGHGAALREGHAEGGALGGDPAGADAEHDAPAGERVERGDHLGGDDRVAIRDDEHSGAEPDPAGRPGDDGERHEGVEDRLAEIDDIGERHHDVIADPDGVVAELLGPDGRAPDDVRGGQAPAA